MGSFAIRRSPSGRALSGFAWLVLVTAVACGAPQTPNDETFDGRDTKSWFAYDVRVPGREPSDLLPAFEASAQQHGCKTERMSAGTEEVIGGEVRHWRGITASCEDGDIALLALTGYRVRIGCARPTTRERCDRLLEAISEAR